MTRKAAEKKRPGRKPKDHVRVQLKFPTALLAAADEAAEQLSINRTAFFEQAIEAALKRRAKGRN